MRHFAKDWVTNFEGSIYVSETVANIFNGGKMSSLNSVIIISVVLVI